MPAKNQGINTATLESRLPLWRDGTGWVTEEIWHGGNAEIERKILDLQQGGGDEIRYISRKAGHSKISVLFSDEKYLIPGFQKSSDLNVRWELDGDVVEKDLRTKESLFKPLSTDDGTRARWIALADEAIENATTEDLLNDGGTPDCIKTYINLRLLGTDTYYYPVYVVRKITTVGNGSARKAAMDGILQVTKESPVKTKAVNLNSRAAKPKFDVPEGLEWLKMPPDVSEIGRNKYAIVEEWYGAEQHSGTLYEGGSGP